MMMLDCLSKRIQNGRWKIVNCSGLALLGYTFCYGAYVAIGGLIFLTIEANVGDSMFQKIQTAKTSVLKKFPNASGEAIDEFIHEMSITGINGFDTANDTETKWTYSQSVFFCVTLVTTIGYGHIAPVSQLGKATCMIYTGFGIPFTVILLTGWVEHLLRAARAIQRMMYSCFSDVLKQLSIKLIFTAFAAVFVGTMFLLLPAVLFQQLEEPWTYLDALYFCFISLTTVGLGDFVPGRHTDIPYRAVYRIGVSLYLLLGVAAIMFLMSLIVDLNEGYYERKSNEERDPICPDSTTYGTLKEEKTSLLENRGDNESVRLL